MLLQCARQKLHDQITKFYYIFVLIFRSNSLRRSQRNKDLVPNQQHQLQQPQVLQPPVNAGPGNFGFWLVRIKMTELDLVASPNYDDRNY